MNAKPEVPTHYAECKAFATWLDNRHILYCHVPNEAALDRVVGKRIREQGGKRGVPDFLIFPGWIGNTTHKEVHIHGVAIEMKRRCESWADVTKEQRQWLDALGKRGWKTSVAYGAEQAKAFVEEVGAW